MSTYLQHSDENSGTTILDNGTKVYIKVNWTEKHSEATIVDIKGKIERVNAHSDHPILNTKEVKCYDTDQSRRMTIAEEIEWTVATLMPTADGEG